MDARTLSADDAQELAGLRRRAYGPDADIEDDPAAVRRLSQLEEAHRAGVEAAPPRAGGPGPQASEPIRVASDATRMGAAPDGAVGAMSPSEATASDDAAPESAPHRPWWRRVPVWSIVATALVVGAGVGAAGISASVPRADVVLRVVASEGGRDAGWQRELRAWGIAPDSAVAFEPYNGVGVWTAASDEGSRCVILENGERPISATCVGGGFDPILDVTMYGGLDEFFDAPPPVGSVIRFIAREDAVEVWVRERQSVEAATSESTPSRR